MEVSEVLFNELTFFKLMEEFKGYVSIWAGRAWLELAPTKI